MQHKWVLLAAGILFLVTSPAWSDVVELKNGDKINGKIGEITAGKMKFSSPVLGDITIDMANVTTFSTDEPAKIQPSKAAPISDKIVSGDAAELTTAGGTKVQMSEVKSVNPPPQNWHGNLAANGSIARGNTDTEDLGISLDMNLRRDDERNDDRFSLGGAYNFGRTGRGDSGLTTTDNWNALGKYDRFWTEKWYGYALLKVEHDRIAALNYRLSPGVGLGYQWIEKPDINFNTEAGVSYVYEDFDPGDKDDHIALRLAYHFDKKLNDKVTFLHNLEYLPAFEDPGDYNLNADATLRAMLNKSFFSQLRVEYQRDSVPAEGKLKNDVRFILGIGWTF